MFTALLAPINLLDLIIMSITYATTTALIDYFEHRAIRRALRRRLAEPLPDISDDCLDPGKQ